jgi:hypothetical protein
VPHVDLLVHAVESLDRAQTRAEADHLEQRVRLLVGELTEGAHGLACLLARAERLQRAIDVALVLVVAATAGVVVRPHAARKSAPHHECRRTLWVRRGEQDAHGRPFRQAIERRAPRAGRIHDRAHVVHRVSSVGAPLTRSDIPVPRLSNRIRREKDASSSRNGAKLEIFH